MLFAPDVIWSEEFHFAIAEVEKIVDGRGRICHIYEYLNLEDEFQLTKLTINLQIADLGCPVGLIASIKGLTSGTLEPTWSSFAGVFKRRILSKYSKTIFGAFPTSSSERLFSGAPSVTATTYWILSRSSLLAPANEIFGKQ